MFREKPTRPPLRSTKKSLIARNERPENLSRARGRSKHALQVGLDRGGEHLRGLLASA